MRILIVSAMFPPIQTGTSFHTANLAAALAERGHAVTVVTAQNRESRGDDYPFSVVRIPALHFPLKNFFKHLRFTSLSPLNYLSVQRIAEEAGAEVILLINHYLDIAFPAIYASLRSKIPVVCSVGTQLQSLRPFRDRVLRLLDRAICGHLVFPFCDRIISWDSEIERYLVEVQGEGIRSKSEIVPYGVNGAMETFLSHRHEYGTHVQILGVGAIIEQRNFLLLVRVFRELLRHRPELRLKIIGHVYLDAPVRLAQELGIEDQVTFTGELPHARVLEEMRRSLFFWGMATGKYVGLGTAAIEAMMLGLPVVTNVPEDLLGASRLRDLGEIIHFDSEALPATVEKLQRVLAQPELLERVGQKGRQFVFENMSWARVAEGAERVLAAAMGQSG
jgi:glycosyltransferase involved in cell wall biosynthesis